MSEPDLRVLARRYGYEFGTTGRGSQMTIRLGRVLWIDSDAVARGECRLYAARELAIVALELACVHATEEAVEAVARHLLDPPSAGVSRGQDSSEIRL